VQCYADEATTKCLLRVGSNQPQQSSIKPENGVILQALNFESFSDNNILIATIVRLACEVVVLLELLINTPTPWPFVE
jgi:predicted transglutaminase-like protease